MANLVSPGVQVQIIDESFYASSGTGTIPFIMVATQQDKPQPGNPISITPGTVKANADKLYLMTSQRELLQTFGNPKFYTQGGTPQNGNELNEYGLYTAYQYLGIANRAWVMRADVDLGALVPTAIEPSGMPSNGSHWLDISNTSWGMFRSNGNTNSSLAWGAVAPIKIDNASQLQLQVIGQKTTPVFDSTISSVITAPGNLVVCGLTVPLTAGMTLSQVVTAINSAVDTSTDLTKKTIRAEIYDRVSAYTNPSPNPDIRAADTMYNLRITVSDIYQTGAINFTNSTPGILTGLGIAALPQVQIVPVDTLGSNGTLAVNGVAYISGTSALITGVQMCEKIAELTENGTNVRWHIIGTTDLDCPGFGWKEGTPTVGVGTTVNPTVFPASASRIKIGSTVVNIKNINIDLDPIYTTLTSYVNYINAEFATAGVNAVASVETNGPNNYFKITNYDGTDIKCQDIASVGGIGQMALLGITTGQTYYKDVTSTSAVEAIKGTVAAVANLPVSPALGDQYITRDDGQLYRWSGSSWASQNKYFTNNYITIAVGGSSSYPINAASTSFTGSWLTQTAELINADSVVGNGLLIPNGNFPASLATFSVTQGANTAPITRGVDAAATAAAINLSTMGTYVFAIAIGTNVQIGSRNAQQFSVGNVSGFANSPSTSKIVASVVGDTLKITSTSGTYFTVSNTVNGTVDVAYTQNITTQLPLEWANIDTGDTYGNSLVYASYSVDNPQPRTPSQIAAGNIWVNLVAANRGSFWAAKRYNSGLDQWQLKSAPLYLNDASATQALGSQRTLGSLYVQYNILLASPVNATFQVKIWNGSAWIACEDYTVNGITVPYYQRLTEPLGEPTQGTLWFNQDLQVDVMVSDGTQWMGYRNMYSNTNPNGVILSATEPSYQSDGSTPLADNDLWIDTSDMENYPKLYRYDSLNVVWEPVDNTDQTSSKGILFADARPNDDGLQTGSTNIQDMLISNYVDPDASSALAYPYGFMLFNTRYSTNNVKEWRPNYLTTGVWRDRWVTASGNAVNGAPLMGRKAQRIMVVRAMAGAIVSNQELRSEANYYNLISAPGYPEVIDEMVTLNTDKKDVAFVVVDPPARLAPDGTSIQAWANNSNNSASNSEDGLITRSSYAGIYYPWGLATNLDGTEIFVPPSMMTLRTIAFNDQVAYPWFAPAGFTRGIVTAVTSVGYLNAEQEYIPLQLTQGQRDVLYENDINPIAFIPGRGLVVYGQKTLSPVESALNRVNVARLVCYLNYQLDNLAKPFLFEPNDQYTRDAVTRTFESFFGDMVSLRAVYDFAVVCDETNNTPTRIDRNELWIDIAIKPSKAIEFIYIPLRILNTGDPLPT